MKKNSKKSRAKAKKAGTSSSADNGAWNEQTENGGNPKLNFKYVSHIREDHKKPIYGIAANHFVANKEIFATVGSNRVTIYECVENRTRNKEVAIKLLKCYEDPDENEIFYTCDWSYNELKQQLIAVGGSLGIIRIINTSCMESETNLVGHTDAINDLKFHRNNPKLLISASKDFSLRLWNIDPSSPLCVAMFGGTDGHTDEVLSADFYLNERYLVSSSMDHSLKIWQLDYEKINENIELNINETDRNMPNFQTRDIHTNYVDCVRSYGNLIVSKSCQNIITCWEPDRLEDPKLELEDCTSTIFKDFELEGCETWFVKFAIDPNNRFLAVGNMTGKTFVWDIDVDDLGMIGKTVLTHPRCNSVVRQVAFSKDSNILLTVCDDGTIWRWDLQN